VLEQLVDRERSSAGGVATEQVRPARVDRARRRPGHEPSPSPAPDADVQGWPILGEPNLERGASFVRTVESAGGPVARLRQVILDLGELRPLVATLRSLPTVVVTTGGGPVGQEMRHYYAHRVLGLPVRRLAQGYLEIPSDGDAYLRGGGRRAVRQKLVRAAQLGLCARELAPAEREPVAVAFYEGRPGGAQELEANRSRLGPHDRWFAAFDGAEPLALCVALVDRRLARLRLLLGGGDRARSSPARFLVHTHLVRVLSEEGVSVLVSDSALRAWAGPREFAHRAGYRVANLRVQPAGR
jgi:hypothetical protein